MGLIEILQDDGDVHVDDDHEVDYDEGHKVDDGHEGEAAVSVWKLLVVRVTVRRRRHQRVQHIIPASGGHESEERREILTKVTRVNTRFEGLCPIIG